MPTNDESWRFDEATCPKRIWDQIQGWSGILTIHFKDDPILDSFKCPETSHLDAADAPFFPDGWRRLLKPGLRCDLMSPKTSAIVDRSVYDLSIVFLYSGRQSANRCLDFLHRLRKPDNTQIIWIDGEPASHLPGAAEAYCTQVVALYRFEPFTLWKLEGVRNARLLVRGKQVLILSDRVAFDEDLYEHLREGMTGSRAGLYSACVFDEDLGKTMAWRAVRGDAREGIHTVAVGRSRKRVFAASLEGTLANGEAFYHFLSQDSVDFPHGFAEALLGHWAACHSMRWFVDGRVCSRKEKSVWPPADYPAVSIVIPMKDSHRDLKAVLESLRALDYPRDKMEVLVVDNNSTDGSDAVAQSFPEVRLLREKKQSSYAARNRGIRESRYGLIAFLDVDCRVTVSWLRELVAVLCEYPWIGAVAGANRSVNDHWLSRMDRRLGDYQNYAGSASYPAYAITMNVIYRKQVFREIGMFDDDQISGSDTDMSWRMQFTSAWKLRILPDKAWVIHRDATTVGSFVNRLLRIGHGLYAHSQKYPMYMWNRLYRIRMRGFEIMLQCLKAWVEWERKTPSPRKVKGRAEFYFQELRLCLIKLGYRRATREDLKKEVLEKSAAYAVFVGSRQFTPQSPLYEPMRGKANAGVRMLHVNPAHPKNAIGDWLLSCLGFTAVWHWRRRLRSIEYWNLIPFSKKGTHSMSLDLKLNASRIRKALGVPKDGRILLDGDVTPEKLSQWAEALGKERVIYEPCRLLTDLSFLKKPLVVCAVNHVRALDIEFYRSLAVSCPRPVVITGNVPASFRSEIQKFVPSVENLYFYSCGSNEALEAVLAQAVLMVTVFRETVIAEEEIPSAAAEIIRHGLPAVAVGCIRRENKFENLEITANAFEAALAVQRHLLYPKWPR
ncbi:MAG: hypothetical protein AUJ71_00290 [Candidatus Omnitrophica bacterium CG1_02_49_16]|nr:MAG: hypothetical protein AUJ71_00290 [Candidatus Omnitrophica bacterium CG1_02_49_16]